MSDTAKFDTSGLADLAEDLRNVGARVARASVGIVKRGAQNVKTDAQQRIRSQLRYGHARRYPSAITYDVTTSGSRVVAEIGPDKDRPQGALGNLLEFGSANNAPLPHVMPAGEAEAPKTEQQLLLAAVKTVIR